MSYQPYPSGGSYQPYPGGGNAMAQQPGARPQSVRWAVWLMYAGGALSLISAILVFLVRNSIKTAVHNAAVTENQTLFREHKTQLTAANIHSLENSTVLILIVILLIGVALWVWMAWANGNGKNWARIVASVLFALNTIYLFLSVARAGGSILFVGLGWLLGLGAIILLWRRDSTAFFNQPKML
jgi:hypothetical protein